jgi:hypothetical protein
MDCTEYRRALPFSSNPRGEGPVFVCLFPRSPLPRKLGRRGKRHPSLRFLPLRKPMAYDPGPCAGCRCPHLAGDHPFRRRPGFSVRRGEGVAHAGCLGGGDRLTDAMLIEPVAVKAGLWVWHEPGIFGVPPAGILGWGFFSCLSLLALDQIRGPWRYLTVPLIPALGTHLALFLLWWGGLRWINVPVPTVVSVGGIWGLSTLLVVLFLTGSPGRRVKRKILWRRVPGALFFFILLALNAEAFSGLPAYALAFIPPYLALLKAGVGCEGSRASPPSEAPFDRCVDPTRGKGPVVQGESPWPKRQIPPLPSRDVRLSRE